MREALVLLLAGLALAGLPGCEDPIVLGSDAEILSFVLSGLLDRSLTIDAENRTVTATVEPMDLESAIPTVTVSEGAELTGQPDLLDGEPVTYVVTAEDGTEAEWTITVTVQYGIAFTLGGDRVVLTGGVVDSEDAELNEILGDGVPITYNVASSNLTYVWAALEDAEYPDLSGPRCEIALFWGEGTPGPGSLDETAAEMFYFSVDETEYGVDESMGELDLTVSTYGDPGDDVTGRFEGEVIDDADLLLHAITDGFFKVVRLEDDPLG